MSRLAEADSRCSAVVVLERSRPRNLPLKLAGLDEESHLMRVWERLGQLVAVSAGEAELLPERT